MKEAKGDDCHFVNLPIARWGAIQPLAAQHCVMRLTGQRAAKRQAHCKGVIVTASEQSGRNRLARLAPHNRFSGWIVQHARISVSCFHHVRPNRCRTRRATSNSRRRQ
jgi:16S rRNA U1498 N3-methylase RsmE